MTSGFHPNPAAFDQADARAGRGGDDPLARALLKELEVGELTPKPWGAVSSLAVAFLSLGTLPVLLWHDRFRDFVDEERQQLRRFADWLRLHSSRPETMDLRVAGDDLGTRPLLSTLSVLSVVVLVVLFATQLTGNLPLVDQVLSYTYRFRTARAWEPPLSDAQRLFAAWSIGLSVAYLFHWLQVRAHLSDVRRYVHQTNRVLSHAGVPRVSMPRLGTGLGLFWVVTGAFLASRGAWWGLAMALSGATQQRYMADESVRLRRALAARVRELAGMPGPPVDSRTAGSRERCPHIRCLAALPRGSSFCPRCGHRVGPGANAIN